MAKRYIKWNCAEEGTVEANARARAYPNSLCVSSNDYDAWSDENERLRKALELIAACTPIPGPGFSLELSMQSVALKALAS